MQLHHSTTCLRKQADTALGSSVLLLEQDSQLSQLKHFSNEAACSLLHQAATVAAVFSFAYCDIVQLKSAARISSSRWPSAWLWLLAAAHAWPASSSWSTGYGSCNLSCPWHMCP
jgi:hypothetical protein